MILGTSVSISPRFVTVQVRRMINFFPTPTPRSLSMGERAGVRASFCLASHFTNHAFASFDAVWAQMNVTIGVESSSPCG